MPLHQEKSPRQILDAAFRPAPLSMALSGIFSYAKKLSRRLVVQSAYGHAREDTGQIKPHRRKRCRPPLNSRFDFTSRLLLARMDAKFEEVNAGFSASGPSAASITKASTFVDRLTPSESSGIVAHLRSSPSGHGCPV